MSRFNVMPRATLTCPCCQGKTDALWCFSWCRLCWYTICGGDQATDWSLSVPPSATLKGSRP